MSLCIGNLCSCGVLSNLFGGENGKGDIPYHENYVFNDMEPTESLEYVQYPYADQDSHPGILDGNYYHGGFTPGCWLGPYEGGYAFFDASHLEGKTLTFLMGSTQSKFNRYSFYSIVNIYADDEQAVDAVVRPRKVPERVTLDLTGVSTLLFEIIRE